MAERIELVYGRAGSGKSRYCYEDIGAWRRRSQDPAVLLVPDGISHTAERELAEVSGGGFADVDVVGMARLGYRVLQEAGTGGGTGVSVLGQQLIMRKLLLEAADELAVLGRAARQPHFAEEAVRVVHELMLYRITPDDLRVASGQASARLQTKLTDMERLYGAYEDYVRTHFPDGADRHEKILAAISSSERLARAAVWIDGFSVFAPRDWEIITALLRRSARAVLTLSLDPDCPERGAAQTDIFHRGYEIRERLRRDGFAVTEHPLPQTRRFRVPALAQLEREAFGNAVTNAPTEGIRVTAAESRADEVAAVMREMTRLVREEGYRWSDLTVLLRDHTAYTDELVRACEHYEIPYFTDWQRTMRHEAPVRLMEAVLAIAAYGWRTESVLAALKTGMLGIADTDLLETVCREYHVTVRDWECKERWEFRSRRSLVTQEAPSAEQVAQWEKIDAVRQAVRAGIMPLVKALTAADTVRAQATAIYTWWSEQEIFTRWLAADVPEDVKHSRRQVVEGLVQIAEEWVAVAGDDCWSLADTHRMWCDSMAGLSYRLIPPTLDHVTISTIESGDVTTQKVVFVPGQNEGVFPAHPSRGGLWTDADRAELERLSLDVGPDASRRTFRERAHLYTAWTRASERLYLSYAAGDAEGGALEISFALRRLIDRGLVPPAVAAEPAETTALWARPRQALALLPQALRAPQPASVWYGLYDWALGTPYAATALAWTRGLFYVNRAAMLSPQSAHRLYAPRGAFRGSVTSFETYAACPFRFFAQYGLRLVPPAEDGLTAADYGQYLHAGLQVFGERLLSSGCQWRDVDAEERQALATEIAETIAPRVGQDTFAQDPFYGYMRTVLDRMFADTLTRLSTWSEHGQFDTVAVEKEFQLRAGRVEETEFFLRGVIDRLDRYRDPDTGQEYYLVIDYKTGNPQTTIGDIYYGLRLQLATYLYVTLTAEPDALPAGIMYVYVHDERADLAGAPQDAQEVRLKIAKELRSRGLFLADRDVLAQVDDRLGTPWSFLALRVNKDGSFRKDDTVATPATLRLMVEYVARLLPDMVERILAGDVAITPYRRGQDTACEYCPYRRLCAFDTTTGNAYRELTGLDDQEALAKMRKRTEGELS